MEKLEFIKRVEEARAALPKSIIPLFVTKYPSFNTYKSKSRVTNVIHGRLIDEEILSKLEELVKILQPN